MIKKIIPHKLKKFILKTYNNIELIIQFYYDFSIYKKFSGDSNKMNRNQLEGHIIAHYHVLEKGISHPEPKSCFSIDVVRNLLNLLDLYKENNFKDSDQVKTAKAILLKYKNFSSNNTCLPNDIKLSIDNLMFEESIECGYKDFSKESFLNYSESTFENFALSRFSVRDFSKDEIDINIIKRAVKIAQKSPSVCNRQTSRVHVLTKRADIISHLKFQNGNRGFGNKINKLLIITSDLNYFSGPKERNQAFVDGGIFAMSLLYALHFFKVGAICLNWAYEAKQDKNLHSLGLIPENEKIILFIGVGELKNDFKVAVSRRKDISEIISII